MLVPTKGMEGPVTVTNSMKSSRSVSRTSFSDCSSVKTFWVVEEVIPSLPSDNYLSLSRTLQFGALTPAIC